MRGQCQARFRLTPGGTNQFPELRKMHGRSPICFARNAGSLAWWLRALSVWLAGWPAKMQRVFSTPNETFFLSPLLSPLFLSLSHRALLLPASLAFCPSFFFLSGRRRACVPIHCILPRQRSHFGTIISPVTARARVLGVPEIPLSRHLHHEEAGSALSAAL